MAKIEVDEVFGFWLVERPNPLAALCNLESFGGEQHRTVGHEAAEVTAHDAVPGRALPLIELCIVALCQWKDRRCNWASVHTVRLIC